MKNIFIYYLAVIAPLVGIIKWMSVSDIPILSIIVFLFYGFVYRPFIDGLRLYQKGVITKQQFKKAFIPCYLDNKIDNSFTELFLKR